MGQDIRNKTANKAGLGQGLKSLTASYYGMQCAHFGVAVMLIGVALTSYFSTEKSVLLAPGQSIDVGAYDFQFNGTRPVEGPNFIGSEAELIVSQDGEQLTMLYPQRRIYLASGSPSTEMAIDAGFLRDLFVTLGEEKNDSAWSMTIYVKPFVRWIWLGAIFMALGGTTAALDKRYRRLRRREEFQEQQAAGIGSGVTVAG
ncbi:MAG: cytochrome c-type biogenesis CcmF C-terminal domain-containing protein, partial [Gammaproteobacteria bacterium]